MNISMNMKMKRNIYIYTHTYKLYIGISCACVCVHLCMQTLGCCTERYVAVVLAEANTQNLCLLGPVFWEHQVSEVLSVPSMPRILDF